MSHSYTVYREALRHVREKQYVIVEADSAEEAVRKSKELSEHSWHEEMPIESWIDSVSGHQAFLEDCGCEICDAPEPPSETLAEAAARYREYREAINRGENPDGK